MIRFLALTFIAFSSYLSPVLAQGISAQSPKIFVASTGSDANDGSRGSPKRSFQAAHDTVAGGGEIVALDTAGYGAVTITKSVGIIVPPGVNGFVTITATSGNPTGIFINAGSGAVVTLRGLIIEGPGSSISSNGIKIVSAGTVVIEDTLVRSFHEGIYARTMTPLSMVVKRSAVRNSTYGIDLETENSTIGLVYATISDTEVTSSTTAFYLSRNATNGVSAIVTRCAITDAELGFYIYGGNGTELILDSSTINNVTQVYNVSNGGIASSRQNNIAKGYSTLGISSPLSQPFTF